MTAAASRRSWARSRCPNRLATRPLERARELPRREVEERDHDGQPGRDRQRPATDRVIDGAGRAARSARQAAPTAAPRRRNGSTVMRRGPQQAGRWQLAPADDLEVRDTRSVGSSRSEPIRNANDSPAQRIRVEGAEQAVEIGGRQRRPVGRLERPGVEDDADAGSGGWARVTRGGRAGAPLTTGSGSAARRRSRPSSSSARSWTTTTSASTTIRRLIFDWPTRRSRNVIGISRMRAPARSGPERHLDLEDVAAGMDAVERDRRQRRRPPRLEAAGQVVRPEPEDDPGEDAAAARDDPPADPPVDDPAALRVARADDEVGRARRRSGR